MSSASRFVVVAALSVAAVAVALSWQGVTLTDVKNLGTPRNSVLDGANEVTIPLPEGPAKLAGRIVDPATSGSYEFLFMDNGQEPTRYDPCRPISWVLSADGMPEGAAPVLRAAAERVSAATGMVLVYEGSTEEPASFDRALIQDQYGSRFAPVVIGWSTAAQDSTLVGSVTGVGGSSAVNGAYGDQRYLRAGVIILDSEDIAKLLASASGNGLAQAIVMHEWGHVVGLAHVDDPQELMHASNSTVTSWGPGDQAGLAIAGAGPCEDV